MSGPSAMTRIARGFVRSLRGPRDPIIRRVEDVGDDGYFVVVVKDPWRIYPHVIPAFYGPYYTSWGARRALRRLWSDVLSDAGIHEIDAELRKDIGGALAAFEDEDEDE